MAAVEAAATQMVMTDTSEVVAIETAMVMARMGTFYLPFLGHSAHPPYTPHPQVLHHHFHLLECHRLPLNFYTNTFIQ